MADNLPKIPSDGSNHGSELRFRDPNTSYTKRFRVTTGEENFVIDVPNASGKLVTTSNLQGVLNEFNSLAGDIVKIYKPDITGYGILSPDGFNDVIQAAPYRTHPSFIGKHEYTEWQASTDRDFNNIVDSTVNPDDKNAWEPYVPLPDVKVYVRYRFGSGDIVSPWSDLLEYTTPIAGIKRPTLDVVKGTRTVIDSIYNGTYGSINNVEHTSTSYKVININTGITVLDIIKDTVNKTKYVIESGVLSLNESYRVEVTHHTNHARYDRSPRAKAKTDTFGLNVEASPLVVQYKYDSDKCKSYIQASIYNVPGDNHVSTDWKVYKSVSGVEGEILFQSTNDVTNLYSLDITSVVTEANTEYIVEVKQNGANNSLTKKVAIRTPNVLIKPIAISVIKQDDRVRLRIDNYGVSVSGVTVEDALGVPEYVKFYITDRDNKTVHFVIDLNKENSIIGNPTFGSKPEDRLFNIDTTSTGWSINTNGFTTNITIMNQLFIEAIMNNLKKYPMNLIHSELDTNGHNYNSKIDETFKIEAYVRFTKAKTNIAVTNFEYNHKLLFTGPVITAVESKKPELRNKWGFGENIVKVVGTKKLLNPDNNLFVVINKFKEVSNIDNVLRIDKIEYIGTDVNKIVNTEAETTRSIVFTSDKFGIFKRKVNNADVDFDIDTYYKSASTDGIDTKKAIVGKLDWNMDTGNYVPGSNPERDFFLTGLKLDKSSYIKNDIEGYCRIHTNIGIYVTPYKAAWINDVKYSLDRPTLTEITAGLKVTNKDYYNNVNGINAIINNSAENTELYIDNYTGPAGVMWTIEGMQGEIEPIRIFKPATGMSGSNKQLQDEDLSVIINHPSLVADKKYLVKCRIYYSQTDISGTGDIYYSSSRETVFLYLYKDLTPKYTISGILSERRITKTITNLNTEVSIKSASGLFINNAHSIKVLFTIKKANEQQATTKKVINNPIENKIYNTGTKFNVGFINIGMFKDYEFVHNENYDITISMYLTAANDASTEIKGTDRLVSNVVNIAFLFDKNKYKPRLTIDELNNPNNMSDPYTMGKFHGIIKLGEASNINPNPTSMLDKNFIHPGFHLDDISNVPVYGERYYCGIWGDNNNFTFGSMVANSDSNTHMDYIKGNQVSYNGKLYEALVDQKWKEFEPGVPGNESKWIEVHEDIRLPNFPELIERLGIPTHLSNLPKLNINVTEDRNYDTVNNIKDYASLQPESLARNNSINKVKGSYYKITSPVTGRICYLTYIPIATNTSIQDLIQTHGELAELDMFTMRFGTGLYYVRIPTYEELDMIVRHETNGAFGGNNTGTSTALAGLKGSEFNIAEYAVKDRPEYTYVLNTFVTPEGVSTPENRTPRYQVYNFNVGRISQVLVGDTKGCIALVITPMYPDEEPWNTSEINKKFPNAKLPTGGYVTPKLSKNNDANETNALLDYDKHTDTGYFGRVTSEQFHTYKEILNKFSFSNVVKNLPGDGVSNQDVKMWDVFWYHGSIVYVPTSHPWDIKHKLLFTVAKTGSSGNSSLIFNSNSGKSEYNRHKLEPNYITGMNGDTNRYKVGTLSTTSKLTIVENRVQDISQLTTNTIPKDKVGVLESTKLHTVKLAYSTDSLSKTKNRVNIVSDCMLSDLCYRVWLPYLNLDSSNINISDSERTILGPCVKGSNFVLPAIAQQDSNNNYYSYSNKILNSNNYLIRLVTKPGENKYSIVHNSIGHNIVKGNINGLINSSDLATPINPVMVLHSNKGMRQLDSNVPSLVSKTTLNKDFLLNVYNRLIGTTDPITNRVITRKEIVGYYFKVELEKALGLGNDLDNIVYNHQEQNVYVSDTIISETLTSDTRKGVLDNVNNVIKTEDLLYNYDYFYQLPPVAADIYFGQDGKVKMHDWTNKLIEVNKTWLGLTYLINGNGPDRTYFFKEINRLFREYVTTTTLPGKSGPIAKIVDGKLKYLDGITGYLQPNKVVMDAIRNTINYITDYNRRFNTSYVLETGYDLTKNFTNNHFERGSNFGIYVLLVGSGNYGNVTLEAEQLKEYPNLPFSNDTVGMLQFSLEYLFKINSNNKDYYNIIDHNHNGGSIKLPDSINIESYIKNNYKSITAYYKKLPNLSIPTDRLIDSFNSHMLNAHINNANGWGGINNHVFGNAVNHVLSDSPVRDNVGFNSNATSRIYREDYLAQFQINSAGALATGSQNLIVHANTLKYTKMWIGNRYTYGVGTDFYFLRDLIYQLPPVDAEEYWETVPSKWDNRRTVKIVKKTLWINKLKELKKTYATLEELGIFKDDEFTIESNKYNEFNTDVYKRHHIILGSSDVKIRLNFNKPSNSAYRNSDWNGYATYVKIVPLKDSKVSKYILNDTLPHDRYQLLRKTILKEKVISDGYSLYTREPGPNSVDRWPEELKRAWDSYEGYSDSYSSNRKKLYVDLGYLDHPNKRDFKWNGIYGRHSKSIDIPYSNFQKGKIYLISTIILDTTQDKEGVSNPVYDARLHVDLLYIPINPPRTTPDAAEKPLYIPYNDNHPMSGSLSSFNKHFNMFKRDNNSYTVKILDQHKDKFWDSQIITDLESEHQETLMLVTEIPVLAIDGTNVIANNKLDLADRIKIANKLFGADGYNKMTGRGQLIRGDIRSNHLEYITPEIVKSRLKTNYLDPTYHPIIDNAIVSTSLNWGTVSSALINGFNFTANLSEQKLYLIILVPTYNENSGRITDNISWAYGYPLIDMVYIPSPPRDPNALHLESNEAIIFEHTFTENDLRYSRFARNITLSRDDINRLFNYQTQLEYHPRSNRKLSISVYMKAYLNGRFIRMMDDFGSYIYFDKIDDLLYRAGDSEGTGHYNSHIELKFVYNTDSNYPRYFRIWTPSHRVIGNHYGSDQYREWLTLEGSIPNKGKMLNPNDKVTFVVGFRRN